MWDLHSGREIQSLAEHPDAVSCVRYSEYSRLAFSVARSVVRVWDARQSPAKCVRLLHSSGGEAAGGGGAGARITDARLSPFASTLFTASGSVVRVWDLRSFAPVAKVPPPLVPPLSSLTLLPLSRRQLTTGHQAPVTCLAVEEVSEERNVVATGSKDHCVKVFEVADGAGGVHAPRATLAPPHYDGVEALLLAPDASLFSASRDASIKRWSVASERLEQSAHQAHRDWILALALAPDARSLLSGCRQGFLKVWERESLRLVSDVRAHSQPIHAIDANASLLFTASGYISLSPSPAITHSPPTSLLQSQGPDDRRVAPARARRRQRRRRRRSRGRRRRRRRSVARSQRLLTVREESE